VYDPDTKLITAVEMTEQVAVKGGEYRPLITVPVDDGEIECWPSRPRFELIEDGDELKATGINLESQWATPWKGRTRKRLVHGTDYDLVVLGISIGALGSICRQLVEHLPKWRDMVTKVDTVATQAMQTLAVAEPRRAGLAIAHVIGRQLREPRRELAGCLAGDSV
jgi:uncharacterized protein with NAD-binding domain and iron-sulfur cluster